MPPAPFVIPPDPSPNLVSLLKYVEAIKEWNLDKILSLFDDDLEYHILPQSLGRPVMNKKLYSTYWKTVLVPMFQPGTFKMTLREVIEAGEKIVFHAVSEAVAKSGAPYHNEYMVILCFKPPQKKKELPKIVFLKEFVDSAFSKEFFVSERERLSLRSNI